MTQGKKNFEPKSLSNVISIMGESIMNRHHTMKSGLIQKIGRLILPTIFSMGFLSASVSQGQTLTDIYWNPFNTNGLGGSGAWSTTPTNWSLNSAGSAQSANIPMPTVGTNSGQSAYYRYNFGGSNGTVSVGTSQTALGAVNITSSGYIFSQSGSFSGGVYVAGVATNATTTLGSGVRVDFSCTAGGAWTIQSNSIAGNPDGTSSLYFTGTNASAGTYTWNIQKTTTLTNVTVFINSQGATNANSAMIVQNASSSTGGHPSINANIVNNSTNGIPLTLGVTSSGNLTNAGTISGSNGVIVKIGGSGNVVLAASSTYTGGSTLTNSSSGSIDLDRVASGHFGTGDIAVLSNSTPFYIRSITNAVDITNNIRIDGVLREAASTSGWRLTNSGTISGAGSILSTNSGSNLYLTGTNNSFGGGVAVGNGSIYVIKFGYAGQNSSIGTNGLITLGGPGQTVNGISIRTVSTNDETSDKAFLLSGASGLQAQIEANLGSTLTLTSDLQSAGSGTHTLQLSAKTNMVVTTVGTNSITNTYTGKLVFNGLLADATGITNNILVGGTGTGIVQLGNANNSFGSPVVITNSTSGQATTLQVSQLGVAGQNSPLGTNGTIIIGGVSGSTCTLEYLGTGETNSKTLTYGQTNVGTMGVAHSGTGILKLTSGLQAGNATNSRTFNLSGTNYATGEFAANLADFGTNVLSISKSGNGIWILSGNNTYGGSTTIVGSGTNGTNSVLRVASTSSLPSTTVLSGASSAAATGTLDLAAAGDYVVNSYGSSTVNGNNINFTASSGLPTTLTFTNVTNVITSSTSGGRAINNNSANLVLNFSGALDISSSTANDLAIGGVGDVKVYGPIINTSTGIRSFTKGAGAGTVSLYGTNTYNGVTTITDGKLVMAGTKTIPAGSAVSLGGGTLKVDYAVGSSDVLGNLSLTVNSSIDLGTGTSGSSIKFASGTNWSNKILTVANSSTGAKLYFVSTANVATNQIVSAENSNAVASLASDGLLSFSVPKTTPTIIVTPGVYIYNGAYQGPGNMEVFKGGYSGAVTFSYSGRAGTSYGPTNTPPINAGFYTVTASVDGDSSYNPASSALTSFEIAKVVLTGSFNANNKEYNGSNSAEVASLSVSGKVGSDDVSLTGGTATFSDANVGDGKTVTLTEATLAGTAADNYTLGSVTTTTANITAKVLTIIGLSAGSKDYDGTTTASVTGTPSYSGLVNSETFSVGNTVTWAFADGSAGAGKTLVRTGDYSAPSGNYTVTQPVLSADIRKVALTITGLKANSKKYDGTTTASVTGTPSYSGLVNSETFSVGDAVNWAFTDSSVGVAKALVRTGDYSAPSGNYTVTQPSLTADITPAGQSIDDWLFGAATNAANVGKYLIGGAATLNDNSERPVMTANSSNLVLSAIIRTNDVNYSSNQVVGQWVTNLSQYSNLAVTVYGTRSANQSGFDTNQFERRDFSVPRTNGTNRLFLRLKATLAP